MALVVVNSHWMALSQHSLSLDGALATKRATWRQPTPTRVKKDNARRTTPSSVIWRHPLAVLALRGSRERKLLRPRNFFGAKPITELGGSARCDEHSSGREGD